MADWLTEADQVIDRFTAHYRMLDGEHGEAANMAWLLDGISDMTGEELAPLFAAAIRRLSKVEVTG
ncbi:MAG TPA: hypothetical protein VI172_08245 [Candidatus Dormibacteraeota bacterium]|jgi:hypothetical protein